MTMEITLFHDKLEILSSPARSPPRTPPLLYHDRITNACAPLPVVHDHGDLCHMTLISIHPFLSSPDPSVMFDLHHHPSTVVLPLHTLAQPATVPPLPCLSISTHLLPWSIVVLPHLSNSFVSVSDVLHTLHRTLNLAASAEELDELTSDIRSQIRAAYERRVESHSNPRTRESETRLGIRRIDLLMGHTRFQGLSIVGDRKDVVVLDLCCVGMRSCDLLSSYLLCFV